MKKQPTLQEVQAGVRNLTKFDILATASYVGMLLYALLLHNLIF